MVTNLEEKTQKKILWHSSAHILAMAVKRLYPDAKLTIGPAIENGFYYDIDMQAVTDEIKQKIQNEIDKIIKENIKFVKEEITIDKARQMFSDNAYKLEMIEELEKAGERQVCIYKNNDFFDLCKGPHIKSTGVVGALKLTKISGVYWRANSKNKMLQRIYGISFPDKKQLRQYFDKIEQAKKRDHRKIGREMDLFSFHDEGAGFPFFHNNGMIIKNELIKFLRKEHNKMHYQEIQTPIILDKKLWVQSGHWDHFRENMYFTKIDDVDCAIKPMNCPGGMLVYREKVHSYRELPLRIGEFGLVHRHELSGVLAGLFRVRCFTQDDAHIFMEENQIKQEIVGVIDLVDKIYKKFGFDWNVELSTKPENPFGSDEIWEISTNSLESVLKEKNINYKINKGDGAFYGPKIDFHIKDCIGRNWQCGTIQLDFTMPEKFNLEYVGKDNAKHRPVMLHRTIYGSLERFMGILIEHYAGKFPLWLAPIQVKIINVGLDSVKYANKIYKIFFDNNIRVEVDLRDESVGYKIRDAQNMKIPYIVVVGENEIKENTITIRTRDKKIQKNIKIDEFIENILNEIK
ncbi:MAG: threonine--tRNA ligase [Candidatus Aenigmarchaeota archaeon ex4484_52]|nr:MAG: threonine--tRNA ligase [Candidatus Aenigmarchaeota archaeon ex4484_52]